MSLSTMTIKFLLISVFVIQACSLKAKLVSIRIENRGDYELLDQFFRTEFIKENYGYVLEGIKPICVRDCYSIDQFPVSSYFEISENYFTNNLLIREVLPIWNKLCAHQKNFVLKAVSLKDSAVAPGIEVQFINIASLKEVIDKNIDLFRYILGPTVRTDQLVNRIAYSNESLTDILQNNLVLTGIVLGYGSHNSLVGGRAETIDSLIISSDCAPFFPKIFLAGEKNHFLDPVRYGPFYLEFAGGNDFQLRNSFIQPSAGFLNVEEELIAIDALSEPLPSALKETPRFIFGAYKGGDSNQPLFNGLLKAQRQIASLLKKPDFLESVLEKIGGKKPLITCEKPSFSSPLCSLVSSYTNAQKWVRILQERINNFEDQKEKRDFIKGFLESTASSPKMVGASSAALRGLNKAINNLAVANAHFTSYAKDDSLQEIVKDELYFKITHANSDKQRLKGEDRVRMGYVISDVEGNVLFANCDTWLDLSQTILGFVHGVQGMHIGEKRTLFIHPALAYGVLTTLPPCIELVVQVHLLGIKEGSHRELPALRPHDFGWIQDPCYKGVIEESIEKIPAFTGSFYRQMLDKIEGLDVGAVIAELDKNQKM